MSAHVDPQPAPPPAIPLTRAGSLACIGATTAAWMVVMSTRHFGLFAPDVNGALGVGVDAGSWLSTAYAACEPIGIVVGGWLGAVFSPRRVLLAGIVLFLLGMGLPLATPDYASLMTSRIVTGFAAGAIMPQAIVVLLGVLGPARTPVAVALYLSSSTAGLQIAGVTGAWGVAHFGWSFILLASSPLGVLAFVAVWAGVPRRPLSWRHIVHADVVGLIALSVGLAFAMCAVTQGDRLRWFQSPALPVWLAAAAICLGLFLIRDWRGIRHPALWIRLYRRWNIGLAAVLVMCLTLALTFSGVIVPTLLAQVQGFRPEQIAPVLWAAVWPQAFAYPACVLVVRRGLVDGRALAILGFATVAAAALVDLRVTGQWQLGELYAAQILQGIGLPMIAVPLITYFAGDLRPPREALPAATLFNMSRVFGGALATAWANTSLRLASQGKFAELLGSTGLHPGARGETLAAIAARMSATTSDPALARAQAVQVVAGAARRQAAVLGAADTLAVLAGLLLASCVLIVMMAEFGSGKALRPHETRT